MEFMKCLSYGLSYGLMDIWCLFWNPIEVEGGWGRWVCWRHQEACECCALKSLSQRHSRGDQQGRERGEAFQYLCVLCIFWSQIVLLFMAVLGIFWLQCLKSLIVSWILFEFRSSYVSCCCVCYFCEADALKCGSEAGRAASKAWREENGERIERAKARKRLSDSRWSYGLLPTMESYVHLLVLMTFWTLWSLMYTFWFLCASSDSYGIFHHPCVKVVIEASH